MSVNMLGLRLTRDVQKRWKNGKPHQRTTGVARRNSNHCRLNGGRKTLIESMCGKNMLLIAITISGALRITPTQKRRVISRSSGFSSTAAVTVRGSRAMPQMGHDPGSERTISGCMGQVYSVRVDAMGTSGSSAMPQEGQAPGLGSRTSGHMG